MNNLLKRLPLPAKLMIIGLIPLGFLMFFAAQIQREKAERMDLIKRFEDRILQSAAIFNLSNALQVERRSTFSNSIAVSKGEEMYLHRSITDSALNNLHQFSISEQDSFERYSTLERLSEVRLRVDQKNIDPREVLNYYSSAMLRLNSIASFRIGNIQVLDPINQDVSGQQLLAAMITHIGIIRGNIYYNLHNKLESGESLQQLATEYAMYSSIAIEFLSKASPDAIRQYRTILNTGYLQSTIQFIESSLRNNRLDLSYDPENWKLISANGVDELSKLQRQLLSRVERNISTIYESENRSRTNNLILLIVIMLLVIIIIFYVIKHITSTLNDLRLNALRIAEGKTGLDIKSNSKDAIGSLAKSILAIDASNIQLAQAAAQIGQGNFILVITPRSAEDILANSLKAMKANLRQFARQNEQTIWLQKGIAIVNDSLKGEQDLNVLCQGSLNTLVEYLNADIGLFYNNIQNFLEYRAGYAVDDKEAIPLRLHHGEKLTGQAAVNRKVMMISDIPENYQKVGSASGETAVRNILIIPLLHNEQLEGVIEMGSLKPFHEHTPALLEKVAEDIAIAMQAAKSREQLQNLLEETQTQAEELQAQHSEVENLNAILENQTKKLQVSEEELRVQQEELMQTNQELEERSRLLEEKNQLIVERNQEIQKKAEELAISTKYKSEFLANMSHELRTPLNSILLLSRLMTENNEGNLSAEQIEHASVIQSSGQGLLSLIDEILDLSKIESGKMAIEYTKVDIAEITEDLEALFIPVAREKKLEFLIDVQSGIPQSITTDKLRLEQVLRNLLSNAFKFTSSGSVSLRIGVPENHPDMLSLAVKDTGIGIPAAKQQLIFEAFQQADGSTRRKYGGTGLGLSISREITRLLGGEIRIQSEPGKGSTFTLLIPVNQSSTVAPPAQLNISAEQAIQVQDEESDFIRQDKFKTTVIPEGIPDDRNALSPSDKLILIVEDDMSFARALLEYTHKKGYKGIVTPRGDEGIRFARQFKPLGILLDIQLPVKNGWEVMEELKNDPQTRHIPVHIMSSHEVKKESLVMGAVDFINKPVAFEQLKEVFEKIETVISRQNKKVLILEDNTKHAEALEFYLQEHKINSHISETIEDGISALRNDEVDCVILDMGVPDQKSYEALEKIRSTEGLENIPIIIFTGSNISRTEEMHIRQYAGSIIIKTAHSYERVLDEISLFLHLVEENRKPAGTGRRSSGNSLTQVLGGKKILVVDDDIRNIFSLTKALESHKMTVLTAMDGREALQKLEQNPEIDLVLMDIMMPVMDGFETLRQLRADRKYKNLPVIAVTAKAMTGDRENCIRAGASDYISKPIDIDQLLSLLRVWLYK